MRRIATVVIAALVLLEATSAAAAPSCQRELGTTDITLIKTLLSLRKVEQRSEDEKCVAYRHHVETVTKVRDVFLRCLTGPKRDPDLRQLDDALENANGVVAEVCSQPATP